LSRSAESRAVIVDSRSIIRKGRAWARLAAQIANSSKNPVFRMMFTITIMPISRKITL
jgi:hypothetical protein